MNSNHLNVEDSPPFFSSLGCTLWSVGPAAVGRKGFIRSRRSKLFGRLWDEESEKFRSRICFIVLVSTLSRRDSFFRKPCVMYHVRSAISQFSSSSSFSGSLNPGASRAARRRRRCEMRHRRSVQMCARTMQQRLRIGGGKSETCQQDALKCRSG